MNKLTSNRNFWLSLLLSIVTLGIYPLYLVYAFANETNIACKDDGKSTSGLIVFILLSIITLNIYSIIWWCKWINRCNFYLSKNGKPEGLQISTYLLTLFFGWVTLGIMYFVVFYKIINLQNAVNTTYNEINQLQ